MNRIILLLTLSTFLFSQEAEVTNIQAAQRTDGSQIVDITYDLLEDAIFEEFTITVEVSFDGGGSFTAISNSTGDLGAAILPGLNKSIVWNFGQQYSDTYSDQVQYKITAESDAIVVVEDEGCGPVPEGEIPFEMVHVAPGDYYLGGMSPTNPEGIPIYINSDIEIYGFQFDVVGATLIDVYGGLSETFGWTVQSIGSNSRVAGFSLGGDAIPASNDILCFVHLDNITLDLNITNLVISAQGGCEIIQYSFEEMDGSCSNGDMNGDGGWNILDVVQLFTCILEGNCGYYGNFMCDSQVDVLDVTALWHCVLQGNCGESTSPCEAQSSMTYSDMWIETNIDSEEIASLDCNYEIMKYEVTDYEYVMFLLSGMEDGMITVNENGAWGPYAGDVVTSPQESIQYIEFNDSNISWNGSIFEVEEGYVNHPVKGTSYYGAYMFANYYGMELPTEFEWEKAARGMSEADYPWGENYGDDISDNANYLNSGDPWDNGTTPVGYFNGDNGTHYSPSPYGAYDLSGNLSEWVQHELFMNELRMTRGGNYNDSPANLLVFQKSYTEADNTAFSVGFRCIRRLPAE